MTTRGNCFFCRRPVESNQTAAWPVTGWEPERAGASTGGANQITGRERMNDGRIAHLVCARRAAELERQGISHNQTSLI